MLSPSLVIFAALSLSSLSGSTDVPRFEVRGLVESGCQFLINPCPEFLNLPKQKCGTPLCGDYWQTGRCTVKRLNGCQDQYCRAHGGCGIGTYSPDYSVVIKPPWTCFGSIHSAIIPHKPNWEVILTPGSA